MSKAEEILEYIGTKGVISSRELADVFDVGISTIQRYLRCPEVKGLFVREGDKYHSIGAEHPVHEDTKEVPKMSMKDEERAVWSFISVIVDNPLTKKASAVKSDLNEAQIDHVVSNEGDINMLLSLNGTERFVLFSTLPTKTLLFKGSIFKKRLTSNIWDELPEDYVRSRNWETIIL